MSWIKILFPLCMTDLCINFQIPASNTVGGVRVTQTALQCGTVKICISFRELYSATMSWIKLVFPYAYVQCMSDLCCKFQIPTLNTVGGDAETRSLLQCDMVQNMSVIQGDVILQ